MKKILKDRWSEDRINKNEKVKEDKMKLVAIVLLFGVAGNLYGDSVFDSGYTWTYRLNQDNAELLSTTPTPSGRFVIPSQLNGHKLTRIGDNAFNGKIKAQTDIVLPEGLEEIGSASFNNCPGIKSVVFPSTLRYINYASFWSCTALEKIELPDDLISVRGSVSFRDCTSVRSISMNSKTLIEYSLPDQESIYSAFRSCWGFVLDVTGNVPGDVRAWKNSGIMNGVYRVEKKYAKQWIDAFGIGNFGGYMQSVKLQSIVLSSSIRESDPSVMDVVYKVMSAKPTVKVRILAFEDGERSFSKIVRPETLIEGTECNVGDDVVPNVEHKIAWRVSSDWKTKLAKVKFYVIASEGELLPLELMTIPEGDKFGKMKISWNAISDGQVFDALLWLYADKDTGLTLNNGVLKNGSIQLASGTSISAVEAIRYVYSKMGYSLLTGAPLTYANQETRLGLSPSGARQYGYKIVE